MTMMRWRKGPRADSVSGRITRAAVATPMLSATLVLVLAGYVRHHYSTLTRTRVEGVSEGATILALEGVHAFVETADAQALMTLAVGADSMVMKARVFGDDQSMGTYAVSLKRVKTESFRLLATGRLVSGERSMMCSVNGNVRLAGGPSEKISVGYDAAPLCNGKRHRSALTTQLGS
ncbi:MAG: hypothetical protein PVH00_14320 [Gemmatimonadota bacterium]